MSDHIFDYDDNDFLYQMDDDYAIGSDGHIVRNAGDNMGFDVSTGEFHITSGWNSSDSDHDDDDDWSGFGSGSSSPGAGASYRPAASPGKNTYQGSGNSGNTYSSCQPASGRKKTDAEEHPGCAAVFYGFIASVVVTVLAGEGADPGLAYTVWILVGIVVAVVLLSKNSSGSSGSGGTGGSVPYPATRKPQDDDTFYRFCRVIVAEDGREYYYRAPDPTVKEGDYVIVPEMKGAAGVPAEVIEARFYSRGEVPVPLETAKYVRKKIDAETYFALVDKAKERENEKAHDPDGVHTKPGTDSPEPTPPKQPKDKLAVFLWIILWALVCVGIASLVMMFLHSEIEDAERLESVSVSEAPSPTPTPEPTATPEPTPSRTKLTNTETDRMIIDVFLGLEDVSDYIVVYDTQYWEPDEVELSDEEIRLLEEKWAGYRDDMYAMLETLDGYEPSAKFEKAWETLKTALRDIAYMADVLSDWDVDNDGEYTGGEASTVNNEALLAAQKVMLSLEDEMEAYEAACATPRPTAAPKRTTPTPRPTATPKRSSTKTNSDPYGANDYVHPDDFYYDYYDDFWDYEDAEDYWEEYEDW